MPYKDKQSAKAYVANNREKIRAKWREMRYDLVSAYGITGARYHEMIKEQLGCCLICLKPSEDLCVDHDHTTGKVRGLLCKRCNAGLGQFYDNVASLARAIEYLAERNSSERLP